jgi:hypothetical protein
MTPPKPPAETKPGKEAAYDLPKAMWNRALDLAAKHFPHTDLQGKLVCDCGKEVGSAGKWHQHILSFRESQP